MNGWMAKLILSTNFQNSSHERKSQQQFCTYIDPIDYKLVPLSQNYDVIDRMNVVFNHLELFLCCSRHTLLSQ